MINICLYQKLKSVIQKGYTRYGLEMKIITDKLNENRVVLYFILIFFEVSTKTE
jgi:hypothetical protein